MLLFTLLLSFLQYSISSNPVEYRCSLCIAIADEVILHSSSDTSIIDACLQLFPSRSDFCAILGEDTYLEVGKNPGELNARDLCRAKNFCPADISYVKKAQSSSDLDIRVSKGLGSRPYDQIRLSAISDHAISSEYFSYSQPFQYKWQSNDVTGTNVLNAGIVTVNPGELTTLMIENQKVEIFIPAEDAGIRGIIISDPCFQSEWIACRFIPFLQTKNNT
jgi:hypothetical protein